MNNNNLFLILGNQLFDPIRYLKDFKNYDFLMMEDFGLCSFYRHHKLKILLTLSSMRSYKDELVSYGCNVIYKGIEENEFKENYVVKLKKIIKTKNYNKLVMFEIEDKFFENEIKKLSEFVELDFISSPMFLYKRKEFSDYLGNNKPLMGNFYKFSRIKQNILIKENKPIGGKWSFDEENRKKLPKTTLVPKTKFAKNTIHTNFLIPFIRKIFKKNVGVLENFWVPTTRKQAKSFLDDFLKIKLNLFGDYEDALSKENDFIFHSALSPLMNLGLLTPSEVIERASKYKDKVKINSYEGFIRQIIGWREFIRGIYQLHSKDLETSNYFGHKNKLTESWYTGKTGILPLDHSIRKAIKLGWNHHIERLMVIANIMNLSMIEPKEVYRWFMELYLDSSDWVMAPNVYGMGLFSDGGIFSTKPYICASSYILKMSDYKKETWIDIVDGLYWQFIKNNKNKLKQNPRLSIMINILSNMKEDRKKKIFLAADNFLKEHTI